MNSRSSTGLIIAGLVFALSACGDDDDPGTGNTAGSGNSGRGGTGTGASGRGGTGGTGGTSAGSAGRDGGTGLPGQQVCPTAEPANGAACQPGRGDCMFGTKICDCLNESDTWVCWDPATDCPTTQPAEQSACPTVGIECELPGAQGQGNDDCECTAVGWDCGGQFCPPAEPAAAAPCDNGDGTCMYGTRICDCINQTDTWACWDPADCPATQPAEQAACDTVGMSCDYEPVGGNECDCTAEGWDCGTQFCPATQPVAAEACEGGDGVCPYGDTSVCDCDRQAWVCWNPMDCPATMPAEAAACTLEGMICVYDAAECECEGTDGFECEVVEPETDAGI